MSAFEKWIVKYMPDALPGGRMSKVLTYTYSLFHRLSRYHLNGRYQIDNNLAMRPLAIGRKNYLFCGNHDAAENAAIIYSLMGCCTAADVNPREWLTVVLTRIPAYNNDYSLIWQICCPITGKHSKKPWMLHWKSNKSWNLLGKVGIRCIFSKLQRTLKQAGEKITLILNPINLYVAECLRCNSSFFSYTAVFN